jgi:hypothetical protein
VKLKGTGLDVELPQTGLADSVKGFKAFCDTLDTSGGEGGGEGEGGGGDGGDGGGENNPAGSGGGSGGGGNSPAQ